jgi:hypothetical protein
LLEKSVVKIGWVMYLFGDQVLYGKVAKSDGQFADNMALELFK